MTSYLLKTIDRFRSEGLINDAVAVSLRSDFVEDMLATKSQLYAMVSEWEQKMGEDDKSLYSLGLRRAIDKIDELVGTNQGVSS